MTMHKNYQKQFEPFDPNFQQDIQVSYPSRFVGFIFSIASSGRFEARIDQALAMTLPPPSMVPGTAPFGADGMIISSVIAFVVKMWGRKSPFHNLIPPRNRLQ